MIVYQLGLKSKFRLMCEGGCIYIYLRCQEGLPRTFKVSIYMRGIVVITYKSLVTLEGSTGQF